ncbi:MAG: ADP-ribosylglycohydrolase family protein [Gammaproteobacteria bacterium]|nr:ADP-ribosylglycohydrolase family protein [Gammaproteobacteria bacterium]
MNLERFEGCLLGLACGDAVGATVEFVPRGRFEPLTDMMGGGKFRLQKGEWTDDTSMALCLAESLIECNGFDALDQMQRYWRWADEGYYSCRQHPVGMGKTVVAALIRFQKTGEPLSGSDSPDTSGNGSLMRLAPVAMFYAGNPAQVAYYAALSSQTTHSSADCLACCQYFALVLQRALSGEQDKAALFPDTPDFAMDGAAARILQQRFRHLGEADVIGSGYVVESLEAALWAFWHTDSFEQAVLAAANLGDDADTTAAICGQLAGAYYGVRAIPSHWLDCLYRAGDITILAQRLARIPTAN